MSTTSANCEKHDFQPRYSLSGITEIELPDYSDSDECDNFNNVIDNLVIAIDAMKSKEYVCDVCANCGLMTKF